MADTEREVLIADIQETLFSLTGRRDSMLENPDRLTDGDVRKLWAVLTGLLDGVRQIGQAADTWRKAMAESEAKLGPILKG